MTHLAIVVEGATEQAFVRNVLGARLALRRVWATPVEVTTKRDRKTGQKLSRGGGQWRQWRREIKDILAGKPADWRVTSMFDLYGLPDDFPCLSTIENVHGTETRTRLLEDAMARDIDDIRFGNWVRSLEALGECRSWCG